MLVRAPARYASLLLTLVILPKLVAWITYAMLMSRLHAQMPTKRRVQPVRQHAERAKMDLSLTVALALLDRHVARTVFRALHRQSRTMMARALVRCAMLLLTLVMIPKLVACTMCAT